MIRLYHSRRARSARVIWLLEELSVPYEIKKLEFTPEALQNPDYLKLHPLGLIPVIEEDDVKIFESGAILEYVLEKYGKGRLAPAPATRERAEYLQWFHYGEATLARYLSDIVRQRFREEQNAVGDAILERARARFSNALAVVDYTLSNRAYICGSAFTAADIMVSYGIAMARIIRDLPPEFKNVAAYLERLKQRPAYELAWA